jgi:hypothetical protein
MKKNLFFNTIVMLSLSIGLLSCEGETIIERMVKNESSNTIIVKANLIGNSNYDKSIAPGKSELLYLGGDGMGATSVTENPYTGITSMIITNLAGDTCIKDYTLQSNWDMQVEHTKKTPSRYDHKYTFVVKDSDF